MRGRDGGVRQELAARMMRGAIGDKPPAFIRLSHRPVTLQSSQEGAPHLAWISSLLSPAPLRGLFPRAVTRSSDQEIFQDELAIHRRKGMFADPAMDQSMREVGVSFHAHDLVARPAARAHKFGRMAVSH